MGHSFIVVILMAAGHLCAGQDALQASFMGHTWFLPQMGMPILAEAADLQHILDIPNVVATSLSR